MNVAPRAFIVLALLAISTAPLPLASASDCVTVSTATFSEGMRVIANAGRQVALGFRSGDPGDGVALVVIITPSVCSGLGIGNVGASAPDASKELDHLLRQVPHVLPLP